ncbi:anti-anti-sigma factor [Isoptericola variabilis J7]|uniref:Sulfate transporter/antisigma-factor antagonist STAS n=1 Tax=Isoptericola variabilis (strain 225) TaxID=743718 RepID=F6FPP3_ISOV2|nr:Sulfate transporter/antisigma-factor antagonist STAS [Isoptericola variabilis 225]TWH32389.1 anti-anti-sigma factor [Isoptericola variabilis J7]
MPSIPIVDERAASGGIELHDHSWVMWGEFDHGTAQLLEGRVSEHLTHVRGSTLDVDASRVTFLDAGGLRLLWRALYAADRVVLTRVSKPVRDVLELSGTADLFEILDVGHLQLGTDAEQSDLAAGLDARGREREHRGREVLERPGRRAQLPRGA